MTYMYMYSDGKPGHHLIHAHKCGRLHWLMGLKLPPSLDNWEGGYGV